MEEFIPNFGIFLNISEFLHFGGFFPLFKKIGFLGILEFLHFGGFFPFFKKIGFLVFLVTAPPRPNV